MAVESGVGPLLNEQRQQLAQELSNAAQSLNRAAIAAERLARTLTDVDFSASPHEQQTQYMAALSATKDLHTTFSAIEGSKRKRKDKVAKDPDAPKKPISSYLIFQEAKRKELMEQHPGSPYKEILKRLGVIWKSMSETEKEPYARAHAKAIAQHGAEMAAYEKNKGISPPTAEKSKAKEGKKPAKVKDEKPGPKPKSGSAVAPASKAKGSAAPPVAEESESASESSEDGSSEEEESTEDESEPEAPPPPKKPRVAAKASTPMKTVKKETKTKEKK